MPIKFVKAMLETMSNSPSKSESKKPLGATPTKAFKKYCEENPWMDQCKIYED